MRKTKKLAAVITAMLVLVFGTTITAFAAEQTQDGLLATITSDKTSYSSGEEIKLNVNVENTNEYDVENVSLELILPDGLKIKDGENSVVNIEALKAGESIPAEMTAVEAPSEGGETTNPADTGGAQGGSVNQNGSQGGTTNQGGTANQSSASGSADGKGVVNTGVPVVILAVVLLLILSAAVFAAAYKHRKKAARILSVLLCTCMLCSAFAFAAAPVKAEAATANKSFTVTHTVEVGGVSYDITLKVSYDIAQDVPDVPDVPDLPRVNGNSAANIQNGGTLTGQGDKVYYVNGVAGDTVYSADTDGENQTELVKENGVITDMNIIGDNLVYLLRVKNNSMYGTDYSNQYFISGDIVCVNVKTGERRVLSDNGNFPVVYEGSLYYLERNGNYGDTSSFEYGSYDNYDFIALYDLYEYDFNDDAAALMKNDVYTLTLNDDKLIYGKLNAVLNANIDLIFFNCFDMDGNRILSSGRIGWHNFNFDEDRTPCCYTIGEYTYEAKDFAYVRTDKNGNQSRLSEIPEINFISGTSPFEKSNYVYYDEDLVFYVNSNNDICRGRYSTGAEEILVPAAEYSEIGRLQIFGDKLYFFADGALRAADITSGAPSTPDKFEYTVDANNMATVTDYLGSNTDVTIPAVIDGHEVLSVDASSSGNFDSESAQNIKSITVSAGIKYIPDWTFAKCKALEKITIPSTMDDLATDCFFSSGENLREYNVSGSGGRYYSKDGILFDSQKKMLMLCPRQKEFVNGEYMIPDGITEIYGRSFCENKNLKRLVMPDSVEEIDDYAFDNCSEISEIVFSPNINMIMWAFNGCTSLKSVSIPKTMTGLGNSLLGFNGAEKVPDFTIYGYIDSEAAQYARENDFKFVPIAYV